MQHLRLRREADDAPADRQSGAADAKNQRDQAEAPGPRHRQDDGRARACRRRATSANRMPANSSSRLGAVYEDEGDGRRRSQATVSGRGTRRHTAPPVSRRMPARMSAQMIGPLSSLDCSPLNDQSRQRGWRSPHPSAIVSQVATHGDFASLPTVRGRTRRWGGSDMSTEYAGRGERLHTGRSLLATNGSGSFSWAAC